MPEQERPTPQHLGVDDFAFRKGRTYGTILIDLATGDPIDLLPDRSAATLAHWLRTHPGVDLISRDRAGAYAEGARQGAPAATQVADRWHLLKNLGDALQRVFADYPQVLAAIPSGPPATSHPADVRPDADVGQAVDSAGPPRSDAAPTTQPGVPPTCGARERQQRHDRRQARYDQIQALVQQGMSQRMIAQHLHLNRRTVRTYARAAAAPRPQPRAKRSSVLAPYKPYLLERWHAGCQVGTALLREIQAQGYRGGRSIVMDFIAAIRKEEGSTPMQRTEQSRQSTNEPRSRPPTPRELAWLVLQRPDQCVAADQVRLTHLQHAAPELERVVTLAQEFAVMVRERQPTRLDSWLERTATSGLGALQSFAGGIRRDYAAVRAALTLPFSNGVVEGNVNRLKFLKRQMYGRAKFDLLRKRVLYAP